MSARETVIASPCEAQSVKQRGGRVPVKGGTPIALKFISKIIELL
ncbi:MAG TPA: hypothetical protein VGW39_00255 [Chthoniobacterales bacterium]|nr:hypothetical protein [Chthoniobacterales bacterium]